MKRLILFALAGACWAQTITIQAPDDVSHSGARIRFTASVGSWARIQYGPTTTYGKTTYVWRDGNGYQIDATQNDWFVSGLAPATLYYACPQVSSDHATWVPADCTNASNYVTFTTSADPAPHPANPTLPTEYNPARPTINGTTYTVGADCNDGATGLQAHLNTAAALANALNHRIVIPAGTLCVGMYTFPTRAGTGWIVVESNGALPAPGTRIGPSDVSLLATIRSNAIEVGNAAPTGSCSTGTTKTPLGEYRWNAGGASFDLVQCTAGTTATVTNVTGNGVQPIIVTAPGHGLSATYSDWFDVNGVGGNTNANLNGWQASGISGNDITLYNSKAGNANWTSGGTVRVNGWTTVAYTSGAGAPADPCSNGAWYYRTDVARAQSPYRCIGTSWVHMQFVTTSGAGKAIFFDTNADKYWLRGLQIDHVNFIDGYTGGTISPNAGSGLNGGTTITNLIDTDSGQSVNDTVIEQCYFHGQDFPGKLGRAFYHEGGSNLRIVDSYFAKMSTFGVEESPFEWNAGILHCRGACSNVAVVNNYAEVTGLGIFQTDEQTMASPPSDWVIKKNYISMPDRYRPTSVSSDGHYYWFRNFIEFKRGEKILIDGNIIEKGSVGRLGAGPAIALSPRPGSDATGNNLYVADVTISNNTIRNMPYAIDIQGHNDRGNGNQLKATKRVKVSNNLIYDIGYPQRQIATLVVGGSFLGTAWAAEDLQVIHNTVCCLGGDYNRVYGTSPNYVPAEGLVYRDNILHFVGATNAIADGTSNGTAALNNIITRWTTPNWYWQSNVWIGNGGVEDATYPASNYWTTDTTTVGFTDYAARNFRLNSGPYRAGQANQASDGTDMGVDMNALLAAQGTGAISRSTKGRLTISGRTTIK